VCEKYTLPGTLAGGGGEAAAMDISILASVL